jgi:hypothetical protein
MVDANRRLKLEQLHHNLNKFRSRITDLVQDPDKVALVPNVRFLGIKIT